MSDLINKSMDVLKREGVSSLVKHASHYINKKRESKPKSDAFKDVLFINGCPRDLLPHPPRYRVTHQMEQLKINGYTCDEVFFENVDLKQVRMYSCFVIFRAPYTEKLNEFVQLARSWNKPVLYDIDDLVIDTKYTNENKYVQSMDANTKLRYDNDVFRYQKLLKICDGCMTTTTALKKELEKYNSNVWINRNTASIEIVTLSQTIKKEDKSTIDIGYFSGSITHNEDFEMIQSVIKDALIKYDHVYLHLVGEIDLPKELNECKEKIIVHPFMDYKKLPELISKMDINLAPLTESIFNEAKSEIKWIEASLVKTCTIASCLGAFKEMVEDHKTGILCSNLDEWSIELTKLIENKNYAMIWLTMHICSV
ncbi:MAG: glycosyltransferase [Faecalibacillus sp.]